jgi:hypothetical protein
MLKIYHQLLSDSTFIQSLSDLDRHNAEQFRTSGCDHCGGVLDRADYERRPRGLRVSISVCQKRRISFCCRRCRRRASPESIFYLRHKVYAFAAVFLTLSLCSGRPPGTNIRRACSVSGASEVTLRRWRGWIERFLSSAEWGLLRKRLVALLSIDKFPFSLVEEFLKQTKESKEAVIFSLRYLSLLSVRIF